MIPNREGKIGEIDKEGITKALHGLEVPDDKIDELLRKPQLVQNISTVLECSFSFTKLHYTLACTAPKNTDIRGICRLIDSGLLKHESMLRGVYKFFENRSSNRESAEEFIKSNDISRDEIEKRIISKLPCSRASLLREMKKDMPYADSKIVVELVNEKSHEAGAAASTATEQPAAEKEPPEKYKWLRQGEIATISMPKDNKINDERILREHLRRTGGKVITRFPPEPNGQLHIGHVKAINLSFLFAEMHAGETNLRFDDTNPRKEREEHFRAIIDDVEWLGYKPTKITASSDNNDRMNEMAVDLIRSGRAYCCHCSLDDIRNRRLSFQKERDAGNIDPTILSPYRNRSSEKNLDIFNRMLAGAYRDGEAVLRFKMDLDSKNPLMLDLVGARIIDVVHPGKNRNWMVYPTYEFALCVSDSLEDVTHSFCSREFKTRQEPYHWLLRSLGLYEPVQWEFSKLILSNTVLSKRKMGAIVQNYGLGWDDPRFYTVSGMRRRGFPAEAINRFVRSVGITFSEIIIDIRILENFVRTELQSTSKHVFCVTNPIRLNIVNLTKREATLPDPLKLGQPLKVTVNKTVYISGSDYMETPSESFFRFAKTQPVGLIGIGTVRFASRAADNSINCELTEDKPLKYIHWVPALKNKTQLMLYKPLFKSFNPELDGYENDIDLDSLEILDGYCDDRILGAAPLDRFQFVRMGFFCCDKTSTAEKMVFNLTLPLKTSSY